MQPLNPASLENNGSTLLNKNIKKTPANKTLKNKSVASFLSNNYDENIIENQSTNFNQSTNYDEKQNDKQSSTNTPSDSTKLTNINQLMNKLYNQNNEAINNSSAPTKDGTIYDIINNGLQQKHNPDEPVQRDVHKMSSNTLPPLTSDVQTQQSQSQVQPLNDSKVQGSDYNNIKTDSYVPYYTNLANGSTTSNNNGNSTNTSTNDELLNKLNYIIYMMEEQQNQKTNYVTEELILYVFLGIFIIFVLDNFAKSTKYVR